MRRSHAAFAWHLPLGITAGAIGLWLAGAACGRAVAEQPTQLKRTFTYKSVGDVQIEADVYCVADDVRRPVLVWIHGGALIFGGRGEVPARFIEAALGEGYVLVSIDYRLAPEVKLPEVANDVFDALQWVRDRGPELFAADPSRLVVAGESAGGYLTLLCGAAASPKPTALLAYYGYGTIDGPWYMKPSEFYRTKLPLVDPQEAQATVGRQVVTSAGIRDGRGKYYLYLRQNGLWPGAVTGFKLDQPRLFDPYCPARNVWADYPPTLLIHGTEDTDVPYAESASMAVALKQAGVRHELITLPGAGHGLAGGDATQVAYAHAAALAFIRRHMVAAPAPGG
jgi:acetyl esterase/lipase